uniref:hypothetical protein n=1 Tax=Paracoccus yeei TaxID=147645 RepID=UPI0015E7F7A2|nr:hypothetical protein [Paracoccus yeei]
MPMMVMPPTSFLLYTAAHPAAANVSRGGAGGRSIMSKTTNKFSAEVCERVARFSDEHGMLQKRKLQCLA